MEAVFSLGVLPVLAAGNEGNIPYIGGKRFRNVHAIEKKNSQSHYKSIFNLQAREQKHPMP